MDLNFNLRILILLIVGFLISSLKLIASDYYVSTSGNDNNSGLSQALAWKTIAKVNSVTFSAGIEFYSGVEMNGERP